MAALMDPRLAGASSKQLGAVAYSGFPVRKITQKLNNNSKFNGRRLLALRKAECQLACISDPNYSIHHRKEWNTTPNIIIISLNFRYSFLKLIWSKFSISVHCIKINIKYTDSQNLSDAGIFFFINIQVENG